MANGHGGRREGSGRKESAVTRVTREVAERELPTGVTPLEVMLRTMRALWAEANPIDEKGKPAPMNVEKAKEAMVVADKAAPYCHARIASVDLPAVPPGSADDVGDLELAQWLAFKLEVGAREALKQKALPKPKRKAK